ncbi:C2 domain-containing protein At1g53590-like [Zingiber officinale]|uniref:C2 domain-containing protein n=1 Tax=Zingiber officinale TaxID=94328 RepID=A0A8J5F5Q5_ZINOF|nr:C2 domain-containing protein At1g53590-like [Zingiber officinale]KAG6483372.1 hypothetical protein ZIOFF_060017 [Zingiber officinale]
MDIMEASILHHIAFVLLLLCVLVQLGCAHPVVFLVSLLYLYAVNGRYTLRLQKSSQFEERKHANQRRLLSDTESVRWLNHAIEKIWPICMEKIASQQFLLPIIPWFLDKFKPWTAKKAVMQHIYLGRTPPMFTDIRILQESADDDHLVLKLGMNFLSADDMSAKLAVQLRKRLGFGITTMMHITGMQVEGKVLVGVKFLRQWPFIGRVRICFVEPPYFQMTVKPIFEHGLDVTELPGISGWLDKMFDVAFGQTLVEPNMLVVDVEKFVSATEENWFTVKEMPPIGYVKLEMLEGADMKPSDRNGFSDPYVKGQLGPYRFRTKTQRKTLSPNWLEEFKIPISSWESPNLLTLQVRDKDTIFDDMLGNCSVNINDLRGGQSHDMWLALKDIKMGRIHLAITVIEEELQKENKEGISDAETSKSMEQVPSKPDEMVEDLDDGEYAKMTDGFEAIDVQGQEKAGVWVHHPGAAICQEWEPRKRRARQPETQVLWQEIINSKSLTPSPLSGSHQSDSDSDEAAYGKKLPFKSIKKHLHKLGSVFHRSPMHLSSEAGHKEAAYSLTSPKSVELGECGSETGEVESLGNGSSVQSPKNFVSRSFKSLLSRKDSSRRQVSGADDDDAWADDQLEIPGSSIIKY